MALEQAEKSTLLAVVKRVGTPQSKSRAFGGKRLIDCIGVLLVFARVKKLICKY
jgi:hypothetical protein